MVDNRSTFERDGQRSVCRLQALWVWHAAVFLVLFQRRGGSALPNSTPMSVDVELQPPDDVTTITVSNTTVGLCSYTHFCSSLGCGPFPGAAEDNRAPLCHCDPACVFYDDCCHDYSKTCGQETPPRAVDHVMLQSFSCTSPNEHPFQTVGRLFVSVCPTNNTDTQTAVLCEDPDADDVLATIPCYGRNSGVHFRNIYCALCHGEELADVIAWKVVVDCERNPWQYDAAIELLESSVKNFGRIEIELGCDVIMRAPDGGDALPTPRPCYQDVVHHCATPQHPLSEACELYTALVTVAGLDSGKIFKNPHCALCNLPSGPDRVEFATDCYEHLPVFCLSGYIPPILSNDGLLGALPDTPGLNGAGFLSPPPISILFDFRSDSSVKIVQDEEVLVVETVQCPPNEVFDPFESRCRRLSCSQGYLLQDNQCVPDFKSVGKACGDSRVGDDIDMEVTVRFGEQCEDVPPKDDDVHGDILFCLEEFLGFDQGSLHVVSPTPTPTNDCPGVTQYSYSVNTTGETLRDFREVLELSVPDSPLCHTFDVHETWSVELRQNCKSLPTDKCTGRWLNETEFSLPAENGIALVYVNASRSWYTLNQTIIRANFQRREISIVQFTDVQICSEPTLTCPLMVLNSSLFQLDENDPGSIIHTQTGNIFRRYEYIKTDSGEIEVCSFYENNGTRNSTSTFFNFSTPQQVLSLIGNIISMVAAAVTFITYCVFKELRQRISLAIMSLVACLFLAQLLLLISGSVTSNPRACATVAVLGHFFWLSTVLWTGVLAFDLNQTFAFSSRIQRLDSGKQTYILQAIFAFGGPVLVVIPCLVLHLCDCTDIPLSYGNENVCWIGNGYVNLVAFGAPIGLMVLVNGVLFAFIIRGIRSTKKQAKSLTQSNKTELQRMRQELIVYIKISSLMGFTWIFGFVAAFSDVVALWYIFIILNSCQGLLIFLSFIVNKKVWRLWRAFVRGGGRHRGSSYTPSTRAMLTQRSSSGSTTFSTRRSKSTEL